jgi:hypothetical protein
MGLSATHSVTVTQEAFHRGPSTSTQRQLRQASQHTCGAAPKEATLVGPSVSRMPSTLCVNHRAVFHIFEANGFPEAGCHLVSTNLYRLLSRHDSSVRFGTSAACVLSRGVQGEPSPALGLGWVPSQCGVRSCACCCPRLQAGLHVARKHRSHWFW